ncbi:MAG: ferrous iron transport protein A [Clostridia bacterium]|nr:ferrous iron transport protein A [Clostridia bacterium]
MKYLYDLKIGEKCRVDKILIYDSLRRRLIDLGLTPDTLVECVGQSPLGDPKAFLIKGAVIALRYEVCKSIRVTEVLA